MKWRCDVNKQKILASLKQSFMLKRYKAQEECEEFISGLRENQEFNSLYSTYTKKQLELAKTNLLEESLKLKHDIDDLKVKINNFLALRNIDQSKLKPKYDNAVEMIKSLSDEDYANYQKYWQEMYAYAVKTERGIPCNKPELPNGIPEAISFEGFLFGASKNPEILLFDLDPILLALFLSNKKQKTQYFSF